MWQLPPVYDNLITENNHLDNRPDFAPSHWEENFRICYLTEKMRSRCDPYFSDLCDRVGKNEITSEDEEFLRSRIQPCPAEYDNENFKNGDLSIIVTTNKKKDHINNQKISYLLPDETEYTCNSIDRVTNLPDRKLSEKLKVNPSKTGNLPTELRLRIGSPVLITVNHSKKKYKEDGLVNGARGFVQSIQVSKNDPEKVEVIWVVFNAEDIGKLYRFEHSYLRESFDPGHKLATPILPERKTFKEKGGDIEYQRTNFPLALAYAMTNFKSQGDTLKKTIVDYGPDKELKLKNFIVPGSFYVAITRVKERNDLFLRSFDRSYIQVNKSLEEKIEAMKEFRSYRFKKIYLDDDIFQFSNKELKLGYLNINGLVDGYHAEYLNADFNLSNLDFLVVAETKLDAYCKSSSLSLILDKWSIVARYDSNNQIKHMGLILLVSKNSRIKDNVKDVVYKSIKRKDGLQIQCLILKLASDLKYGFIYCRSTPTHAEIDLIKEIFDQCKTIMGDLNLSHRIQEDRAKIIKLCGNNIESVLQEITRKKSNNQLDYVLVARSLVNSLYTTSYSNFISDHNSIILRIGEDGNSFCDTFLEKINFDVESHTKKKMISAQETTCEKFQESSEDYSSVYSTTDSESDKGEENISNKDHLKFTRKFVNFDKKTCWLNSCLQLILTGLEYHEQDDLFSSQLGLELLELNSYDGNECLDSANVKNILVEAEDMRIASRMSEVTSESKNQNELTKILKNLEELRLNLISGEQCARDFFLCLRGNALCWPDVNACFSFNLVHETRCLSCNHINTYITNELYVELDVPAEDSSLNLPVEDFLNSASLVGVLCDNCNKNVQKEVRVKIDRIDETKFITAIVTA